MVASGTESGTATGVQGPDVSIRNYLFFFFLSERVVCLLCDVRKLASAAQVLWASKNSL